MSGRSRHLRNGVWITNRKTDRRNPKRPVFERCAAALRDLPPVEIGRTEVRVAFLLPRSLADFVSPGSHRSGAVTVLAQSLVRITSHSSERCFGYARDFFADVARERPGFTVTACVMHSADPERLYSRFLVVVRGAMVVCAGMREPKIFEIAA